jgi:hypothetical protein
MICIRVRARTRYRSKIRVRFIDSSRANVKASSNTSAEVIARDQCWFRDKSRTMLDLGLWLGLGSWIRLWLGLWVELELGYRRPKAGIRTRARPNVSVREKPVIAK